MCSAKAIEGQYGGTGGSSGVSTDNALEQQLQLPKWFSESNGSRSAEILGPEQAWWCDFLRCDIRGKISGVASVFGYLDPVPEIAIGFLHQTVPIR